MSVSATVFDAFKTNVMKGSFNLTSDTIKCMLCTSSYSPNKATDSTKANVTSEVVGTGYVARGQTLASPTVTLSGDTAIFGAAQAATTWSASSLTARYAVIFKDSGTDSTSP